MFIYVYQRDQDVGGQKYVGSRLEAFESLINNILVHTYKQFTNNIPIPKELRRIEHNQLTRSYELKISKFELAVE